MNWFYFFFPDSCLSWIKLDLKRQEDEKEEKEEDWEKRKKGRRRDEKKDAKGCGELLVLITKTRVYRVRKEIFLTTILLSFPFLSFLFLFFPCYHYSSLRKFSDLPWAKLCLVFKEAGPSEKGLTWPQISTGPWHWSVFTRWEQACEAWEWKRQWMKSRRQSRSTGSAPLSGPGSRRRWGTGQHQWEFQKQWEANAEVFQTVSSERYAQGKSSAENQASSRALVSNK